MTQQEISHNFYVRRKENGLCVGCGKPLDKSGIYCKECTEKRRIDHRETRAFWRSLNICPRCGKNKLYGDEKHCPECLEKLNKQQRKYYQRYAETIKAKARVSQKLTYQQRKEKGICVRCGKRKAQQGFVRCGICMEKDRQAKSRRYKLKNPNRREEGYCYRCGNPIENKRYKLCNKCAEQNRQNAMKANRTNHYWRQLNKELFVKG